MIIILVGIPASFWINREKEYRSKLFELEQKEEWEQWSRENSGWVEHDLDMLAHDPDWTLPVLPPDNILKPNTDSNNNGILDFF